MFGFPVSSLTPLPSAGSQIGLQGFSVQHASLAHVTLDSGVTNAAAAAAAIVNGHQLVPVMPFDSASANVSDARGSLTPKIKGSFTLASFAKNSNKFSPY
jgi:hypothetical protein